MVVGLGVRPSVCFGQILKSSDEIRSRNGVLAFGTKEFRNFVLLHPEVEICGPVGAAAAGAAGMFPWPVVSPVLSSLVWTSTWASSKSSFSGARSMLSVPVLVADILAVCKLYSSYKRCLCFDSVSVVGFVCLEVLIDVRVSFACRLLRVNLLC